MAVEITLGGDGELFVGEDKTLRLALKADKLTGIVPDMTGWNVVFDVRAKDASPDPAIVTKTMTILGAYAADKASNLQRALVVLTDDELNLFKAATYRYSMKRMDAGFETVLAYGDFAPQKATAP